MYHARDFFLGGGWDNLIVLTGGGGTEAFFSVK